MTKRTVLNPVLAVLLLAACGGGTLEPPSDAGAQPGGLYGRCLREGELFEAKEGSCCPGLTALDINKEGEPGWPDLPPGCVPDAPPSMKVRGVCGNGVCGKGETRCNCPTDCET